MVAARHQKEHYITIMKHFLSYLQDRLQTNWNKAALTDYYGGANYTLGEVATMMRRLEVLMDAMDVKRGDKVALCGKNCANWGVAFLSCMAARRVAVSILPDFTPEAVECLVDHSDTKLFFASDYIWKSVDVAHMPQLKAAVLLEDFELAYAADDSIRKAYAQWEPTFQALYPNGFQRSDVAYPTDDLDELAMINYTSGTTSSPKGVMISHRSIASNVDAAYIHMTDIKENDQLVSILPMAHMYGLILEFLFEVTTGLHIYFLGKTPSPAQLLKAFNDVRPYMIVCVPMVVEKIFRKAIMPKLSHPLMKMLWNIPLVNIPIRNKVKTKFIQALGGNLRYVMIGGAAINQEVEKVMHQMRLPYIVGYGMTECGPLIAYEDWQKFAMSSCGKAIEHMEVRIDSEDPLHIPGEIQTKGDNLMLGYYKNEEATRATVTDDGWLRTGDLGLFDKKGNIFIKGRSKNMLLSASGQNIYPEEIEDKINSIPYVMESLVVDRGGKLTALIYPDPVRLRKHGKEVLNRVLQSNIDRINKELPKYEQILAFELRTEEFEKTPKRSIKRYLYS